MKPDVECLNFDKVLQITELMSDFGDNETENLKNLLVRMGKMFKCDNLAYIQHDCYTNTLQIISPSEKFIQHLRTDKLYNTILDYSLKNQNVTIIDENNKIPPNCTIDYFAVVTPVILKHEHIGCIIASYKKGSAGSYTFQTTDLSHYKLISNIISIQENSYRVKSVLKKTAMYRKILNELSEQLIRLPNEKMDSYIQSCIQATCEAWDIDRGYLFLADFKNLKMNKTNEWCNSDEIESLLVTEYEVDMKEFPWENVMKHFMVSQTPIHIPNVNDLMFDTNPLSHLKGNPQTEDITLDIKQNLKKLICKKKLKSILLIPVSNMYDEKSYTIAILGFSQILQFKQFSDQLIDMLKTLAFYLSEAVRRRGIYQDMDILDQSMLQNIIEWQALDEENVEIFDDLQSKMRDILEKHARVEAGF